ncbi:MAG: 4-hydroxy-3-methylbut-2-enyl diphosphate reductase [Planctomycetaceae bacterium]|nr:4-hydroxy-3-methylbut-2-enyl diphosphate reductase [Planctomycetaceae bacterium]
MNVILASPRGFCAGVNMAIESLELALEAFGAPVYVYHEIVHNKYVVTSFREKGAIFVDDLNDVPAGSHLLFSAHGISPEIRNLARERRLHAIDATCPLVTKVHIEARRFAEENYTIVLIGHEGHDEVIGTMGEAPQAIVLVETTTDVDQLNIPDDAKLAYLTQTTLSVDDANRIINRLRKRFPQIEGPPKEDICYATQNRQEAVRSLAVHADLVLVLGSQNSSNSQRLRELAAETGKQAHLIDGPNDMQEEWFEDSQTVLVTAGASAPESVVQACLDHLVERWQATVEVQTVRVEEVHFPLPRELRSLSI